MVNTQPLPKTPARSTLCAEPLEKPPVRAAATPHDILGYHATEADDNVAPMSTDSFWSPCSQTPQSSRAAQWQHGNAMGKCFRRSFDSVLRAKKMHFVAEVPQSFGSPI